MGRGWEHSRQGLECIKEIQILLTALQTPLEGPPTNLWRGLASRSPQLAHRHSQHSPHLTHITFCLVTSSLCVPLRWQVQALAESLWAHAESWPNSARLWESKQTWTFTTTLGKVKLMLSAQGLVCWIEKRHTNLKNHPPPRKKGTRSVEWVYP